MNECHSHVCVVFFTATLRGWNHGLFTPHTQCLSVAADLWEWMWEPKYWKKPYLLNSTDSVRFWFLFRTALTHLVADSGSRVIGLGFLECFCFYQKTQIPDVDSLLHSISCRSFLFHLCRTALLGFLWRVVWSWSLYCALPLILVPAQDKLKGAVEVRKSGCKK